SSLLGALLAGGAARRLGVGPAVVVGLLLVAVSRLFVPLASGATLLAASLLIARQLLGDGAETIYEINATSLRQQVTRARLLGRVNGSLQFVGLAATLLGTLAGGLVGEALGLRATLFLSVAATLLAALLAFASPVGRLRAWPAAVAE